MGTAGVDAIHFSDPGAGSTSAYSINMASATNALTISTGSGNDTIVGTAYGDTIFSDAGATASNDVITGGAGNDTIYGGLGADTFNFAGDFGADLVDAQTTAGVNSQTYKFSGINFADLSFSFNGQNGITVTTTAGASVQISNFVDSVGDANALFVAADKSFHVVAATGHMSATTGADYVMVSAAAGITIDGKGGADTIVGGAGADTFIYKTGFAKFTGGTGFDRVSASNATASVTLDLVNTSLYSGVEEAFGGAGNDLIRGSASDTGENLVGNAGKDNIWSNAGADTMEGGAGVDTYWFQSGDGADKVITDASTPNADVFNFKNLTQADLTFVGYDANDALDINYTGDSVHISGYTTTVGNQKNSLFQTSDNTFHVFMGSTGTGAVDGTTTNDYINLSGAAGGFAINSKAGADTIIGGMGDDVITYASTLVSVNGKEGTNTLTAAASTVAVDINLADTKYTNVTQVVGGAYADVLRGNADTADSLNGGLGADHIWGRAGNDTLTGGGGADTFWFGNGDGMDTITDGTSVDVVKMYNAPVTSQSLSGGDLVLNIADGSSLTITGWESSTSKLNKFSYNGTVYKLSDDATTWSKA